MSFKRATLIQSAQSLVRDRSSILLDNDWEDCVNSALDYHSRYRRNILVVPVTATGVLIPTGDRVYPLPSGWEIGFSDAGFAIEYPIDLTAEWPTMLRPTMSQTYDVPITDAYPLGKAIRFRETLLSDRLPAVGTIFNVHFQVKWLVTNLTTAGNTTTAYDSDYWPLVWLVTSQAALMMSAQLSQNVDSTMQADTADYRGKNDKFTTLSEKYFAKYKAAVIPPTEDLKAYGVLGDFEQDDFNRTLLPFYWRNEADLLNSDM